MRWHIRLSDEHGVFWLTGERRWSDDTDDALAFSSHDAADEVARAARGRTAGNPDWFPRIRVVQFKLGAH